MSDVITLGDQVLQTLYHELKPLQGFLDDASVQEVMVNSPKAIFVEKMGKTFKVDVELAPESLRSLIVTLGNSNVKSTRVIMDARLPGLRLAATMPPVGIHGPALCIRRHANVHFSVDDYITSGAFSPSQTRGGADALGRREAIEGQGISEGGQALAGFFERLVRMRENFIVTGSTSSGKTAFLNMLVQFIPSDERVVTIEDTSELSLPVPNWLAFEAHPEHGADVRALVKHALRNRPSRIIVGEGRGAEFFDILDAYNTGHPGSTVTYHSNSAAQALPRLENMIRMAPEASNWPLHDLRAQIAATFGYIVHCSNAGGVRGPSEVLAIRGCTDGQYELNSLFRRQQPT